MITPNLVPLYQVSEIMLLKKWTLRNTLYAEDRKRREKIKMTRSHVDLPRGLPLMTSLHMSETRNSYAYYVPRQEARLVSLSLKPVCFHCTKLSWIGRVWKQKKSLQVNFWKSPRNRHKMQKWWYNCIWLSLIIKLWNCFRFS